MNETQFRAQCIARLEEIGYRVIALRDYLVKKSALGKYRAGYPDITAAGRGRVVFLELKMNPVRYGLTEDQMQWEEEIVHAIGRGDNIYFEVATPENWDGIMEDLA